ncbi:MAG: hypothetical protein QJR01_01525 [Kyrpidia sp.]|nr:hypothetical protein [Kyrpidia sp.]
MKCWTDVREDLVILTIDESQPGTRAIRLPFSQSVSSASVSGPSGVLIHAMGGVGFDHIARAIDVVNIHAYMKHMDVSRVAYVATDVRQLTVFMRLAKAWGIHHRASYFNHVTDALKFFERDPFPEVMTA